MESILLTLLLLSLVGAILSGFPVAFSLAGISLIWGAIGALLGVFDTAFLSALPHRIYGIMTNDLLIAVPLFVFMGVILETSKIAEDLLINISRLFGNKRAGLAIATLLVGMLLAASTGIVGATVITMGLISLPTMLKHHYDAKIASGTICAAGTLGQVIPPSIVLILLGDQISAAHQSTQLALGNIAPDPVSIADLFVASLLPGLILVGLYICWLILLSYMRPNVMPKIENALPLQLLPCFFSLLPPILLIILVLGSILSGIATATESASIGAIGALLLAIYKKKLTFSSLQQSVQDTALYATMVFTILIGATLFTLVFRGLGGDAIIHDFLTHLPGGLLSVMFITMLLIFFLGFFLDFIEITFVVIPIIVPVLLMMGANPIWLAVMIALNLQTSFLTPPFGFSLFYLRSVAPKSVTTSAIYKGIIPFVAIQILALVILSFYPKLATALPKHFYGTDIKAVTDSSPMLLHNNAIDF